METEKQLISHLYQNKENGKWIIQTNDEHQRGVAEMATSFSGLFGLPSWGIRLECFTTKEKSVMHFSNISARQAVYLWLTKIVWRASSCVCRWNIGNEPYGEECIQSSCQPDNLSSYRPTWLYRCGERHREKATSRRDKQRGHSSEYTPVERRTSWISFSKLKVDMKHFHHLSRMLFPVLWMPTDSIQSDLWM